MDRFGLFNILSKLQTNENQRNALQSLLGNLLNSSMQKSDNSNKENSEGSKITEPPPYFKSEAILNVIKKHDLLSKQIDKDNK